MAAPKRRERWQCLAPQPLSQDCARTILHLASSQRWLLQVSLYHFQLLAFVWRLPLGIHQFLVFGSGLCPPHRGLAAAAERDTPRTRRGTCCREVPRYTDRHRTSNTAARMAVRPRLPSPSAAETVAAKAVQPSSVAPAPHGGSAAASAVGLGACAWCMVRGHVRWQCLAHWRCQRLV